MFAAELSPGSEGEPGVVRIFSARGNGLGTSGRQTLSSIIGNRAINNGPAIDAFPGIEHEKLIPPRVSTYTAGNELKQELRQSGICQYCNDLMDT